MGDGLGAASLLLALVALAILVGGPVLLGLAGWRLTGRRGRRAVLPTVLGIGFGALGAFLLVAWLFLPLTWRPPARLVGQFDPAAPLPAVVLVVEDARRGAALDWSGPDLPFVRRIASVPVPPSGIVRVRALGPLFDGNHAEITWPDGVRGITGGASGGLEPVGGGGYVYGWRDEPPPMQQDPTAGDPEALVRYVRMREGIR